MKLDLTDPGRWAIVVGALHCYRQTGIDKGYHPIEFFEIDDLIEELDPDQRF